MRKIHMVDLKGQYQNIKGEVDSAIQAVIDNAAFIKGNDVKELEGELARFTGAKHVIGCANGTDALQIALMALELQPGDEVITSTFTFIATAEVIALLKLKPVFVDVDVDTFMLNIEQVEKAVTDKTKAIIPVHLYGQSANMEELMTLAQRFQIPIVEDTAQAIGTEYTFSDSSVKQTGTIGDIGCTSFFPSKNLGAFGDGGALFTNDDRLAKKIRSIVNHGSQKKYYHEEVGVNSRLDTLQAAILRVKLARLHDYIKARQKAAAYYDLALQDCEKVIIPQRDNKSSHTFHQYTLRLVDVDRGKLQEFLKEQGIPSMVYYPVPMHMQEAYASFGYKKGDFPVSEKLAESVISLPMHTELDEEQLKFITTNLKTYLADNG